jgi:hypothetical protein
MMQVPALYTTNWIDAENYRRPTLKTVDSSAWPLFNVYNIAIAGVWNDFNG